MLFKFPFAILLACAAAIYAQSTIDSKKETADSRLFLSTFTVILSTITSTTTVGTTTTCTTSSTAMSACSAPAGRRRRGILYDEEEKQNKGRRGLFYNDDEADNKDDNIPLSTGHVKRSAVSTKEPATSSVTVDSNNLIPLTIQSGFSLPEGFPSGTPRFKLAYGTSTITTTATSIFTRSLTIVCSSITNYPTCSGSG